MQNIGLTAMFSDAAFQKGIGAYNQSVDHAVANTDHASGVLSKLGAVASGALVVGFAAAAAGAGALFAAAKIGIDTLSAWNDQVNTLSDNLGTSGEQSSAWAVAFNHVGLSVDEGGAGLNFFTKSLAGFRDLVKEGKGATSDFGKSLKQLGVNAFDAKGNLRTFDDLMPDLLDAFQKLPPGVNKSALAMQLFGARAGTKFLDFLSQGSEGLDDARKMAKAYGLELDTDLSNAVEDFGFQLNDLNLGLKGFWVTIGREVLPIASRLVSFVTHDVLPPFIKWAQDVIPLLVKNVTGFVSVVGEKAIPILTSLWNVAKLLVTGDFSGGIFGFTEDSIFIGALLTARDVVTGLFETLTRGDWGGAWKVITDGAGNLWATINDQIGDPGNFLQGKLHEAVVGAQSWLKDHGPETWETLVTWGSNFWFWLTDPKTGAIGAAKTKVLQIATALGTELDLAWTETVEPALTKWGNQFWNWLSDPKTGAVVNAGKELESFAKDFAIAANAPEVLASTERAGYDFGKGFFSGANKKAAEPTTGVEFINKFIDSLGLSAAYLIDAGAKAAFAWGEGFGNYFQSDKFKADLITWLTKIARDINLSIYDLVFGRPQLTPEQRGFPGPMQGPPTPPQFLPPDNLAPGQQGGSTVPASNAFAGATAAAQMQIAAVPVALQVQIGNEEIQNAVVTWSNNAVTNTFGAAVAQLNGGQG